MKSKLSHIAWPVIGLAAVVFSGWLLVQELRNLSLAQVAESIGAIPAAHWLALIGCTLLAYAALAEYDRIALRHLGRILSWPFVAITSFTTYALAHNIGASVFSGALVRYRAYSSKGLSAGEIGMLIALCSLTFTLGVTVLGGLLAVSQPALFERVLEVPAHLIVVAGVVMLLFVAFYVVGSLLHFRPLKIGGFSLVYPRPEIVARQLIIGPIEVMAAAGIIYFALPEAGNPGFLVVLGVFVLSFSAALISHAPGGLGVLEYIFVTALDEMAPADVIAALIVFRIFYLLLPLAMALVVVLIFERGQLGKSVQTNGT